MTAVEGTTHYTGLRRMRCLYARVTNSPKIDALMSIVCEEGVLGLYRVCDTCRHNMCPTLVRGSCPAASTPCMVACSLWHTRSINGSWDCTSLHGVMISAGFEPLQSCCSTHAYYDVEQPRVHRGREPKQGVCGDTDVSHPGRSILLIPGMMA